MKRLMDAESQYLLEQNAEIERLKKVISMNEKPIWPTGQWREALKAKESEIERLKGENARLKQLITELATYLEGKRRERYDGNGWISTLDEEGEELLKHLREATR